jgi:hypothetical protein
MSERSTRCRPIPLPLQYSAEIVRSDGLSSKLYLDGMKRCIEDAVAGITTRIVIWRPDLGKSYVIEMATRTYFTVPFTPEFQAAASVDIEDDVEWEHADTESLDLRPVDIYDVFPLGGTCRRARVYVDTERHIRLKNITFNKLGKQVLTIETKNVVMGPPPASVFELPPGLQEIRLGE